MDPISESVACLVRDKALWRTETRHEAMLLMGALFKEAPQEREAIVQCILTPPEDVSKEPKRLNALQFEFLNYLEALGVGLSDLAAKRLKEIRDLYPNWKPSKYPGMSHWTESGWVGKRISGQDLLALSPEQAIIRLHDSQDTWESSRRDIAEALGAAIVRNWSWGEVALREVQKRISDLSAEQVNPIWWGVRAAVTENKDALSISEIRQLLACINSLITSRPEPGIWTSVPSVLQELIQRTNLKVEEWDRLAISLGRLFWNYDYEREKETSKPIEWLDRAINHPYGDIAEIYRDLATEHVRQLGEAKATLELKSESKAFFEFTLSNVGLGSQYGLCLIAERMSWLEVVDSKFAAGLAPFFDWSRSSHQAEIAWSGFLWSRTLSKALTEAFETTYLETAKHVNLLGKDERDGLANHVAAVFWFNPKDEKALFSFASAVNSEVRQGLLSSWRQHLQQAEGSSAGSFFKTLLLGYWDWCARQPFFSNNDSERSGFLNLVPLAGSSFPEAVQRAIKHAPGAVEHPWHLLEDLRRSSVLQYRDEVTVLLLKILQVSKNPNWDSDQWKELWKELERLSDVQQNKLRNALAQKGIDVELHRGEPE